MVKQLKTKKMKKKFLLLTALATLGLKTATMAQTVPSYVPTNGLIGWWPFNGNANDESGNGNNGSVIGGAILGNDRYGSNNSSYEIDGLNCPNPRGLSIPAVTSNVGDYSISIWYKSINPLKQYQCIINSNPHQFIGASFNYLSSSSIAVFAGNGTWWSSLTDSITIVNASNWNHLAIVKNGLNFQYFNNGILMQTMSFTNTFNTGNISSFVVGAISINGGSNCYETFHGSLDDLGIWNRALTQQEITDLYNGCQLTINTQPTNQTININNNAQFVVNSSDPSATYQWQIDLGVGFQNLNSVGQYSGSTNDTLTVSNVTLTNNNQPFRCIVSSGSCSDTSAVAVLTVNNNVGINETSQDKLFAVFPNPAQSVINVKSDGKLIGSVYSINDNTGKVVLSGKLNAESTTIELGNLSGGIYMFSVGENMKQTFKVIKE